MRSYFTDFSISSNTAATEVRLLASKVIVPRVMCVHMEISDLALHALCISNGKAEFKLNPENKCIGFYGIPFCALLGICEVFECSNHLRAQLFDL